MNSFIELKNVKKTYIIGKQKYNALDGIDLSINQGEFVVILGPSGAGKSTLLNLLGGMDKATSGQIIIGENDIAKYTFDDYIRNLIKSYINNHKISNIAHEEIMSMVHSDKKIAEYYYKREIEMTNSIKDLFIRNNFKDNYLYEKVHIMIGLIDNLCHEVIYHKHSNMEYNVMTDLVIENIKGLFKKDLK